MKSCWLVGGLVRWLVEKQYYYVFKAGLRFLRQPQPPKHKNYKCAITCLAACEKVSFTRAGEMAH